jgi:aryl-alcohol dehydrogenase-like predicted oxidoreductase
VVNLVIIAVLPVSCAECGILPRAIGRVSHICAAGVTLERTSRERTGAAASSWQSITYLINNAQTMRSGGMEYTTLGGTGLKVSVAGLGCGGFSRLGLGAGKSEADAVALVHEAFLLGVNLFDTAAVYGTEAVLGKALKGMPRDQVVVTTKAWLPRTSSRAATERLVASLDNSLRALGTDYVDVFQLHGVAPEAYQDAHEVLAPVLLEQRQKGKVRFLGVTETGSSDPEHEMLQRAAGDGVWDVVMVAFHMMHQNARRLVFPRTIAHRVGTLIMFAVRNIFSQPQRLKAELRELAAARRIAGWLGHAPNPLGFLIHTDRDGALSVPEAAYRYVRHEPGVDVVLFGTGSREHLRANIASILKPPLPETDRRILAKHFGHLSGVGLDPPTYMPGFSLH